MSATLWSGYDYKEVHSAWRRGWHADRTKRPADGRSDRRSAMSAPLEPDRKRAGLRTQDQRDAELAAKRAMTNSSHSADSTHLQHEEGLYMPTPRRYKAVGNGLSNKTLRSLTPSQIPRPSSRRGMKPEPRYFGDAIVPDHESTSETYGALPSSYRRLRKAKSMLSPRSHGMSSQQSHWMSSRVNDRALRSVTSSAMAPTSNLRVRIKRSLSFLRPKSTLAAQNQVDHKWGGREEAVQMARAQFLDEMEHQRLENRASSPSKSILKLQHKSADSPLRLSQTQETDQSQSASSDTHQSPEPNSAKRSLSTSFRLRFRKVLGRSVNGKEKMPPQQLDARKSHMWDLGQETGVANGLDAYLVEDEAQTVQHSLYLPAQSNQDALEDLNEISHDLQSGASRESLHSNSRSRVTSWTNSSMTGSISLRSGPIERNRLSIIKEDGGPHQPSSSAGRHIGDVAVFREPLQPTLNDGRILPPIDSQRVYSALIKRINQEEAEAERTRVALEAINQSKTGSAGAVLKAKPTIRAVRSDSSLASRGTVAPDEQHRDFSLGSHSWHLDNNPESHQQHDGSALKQKERLAMQQSQSSFFPFSSEKNPGAPSPFKKFLDERERRGRNNTFTNSDSSNDGVIARRLPGESIVNRPRYGMSSESIYSQATNGAFNEQYISPIGSSEDFAWAPRPGRETPGMATIIPVRHSHSRSGSNPSTTIRRQTSSCEWNPWSDTLTAIRLGKGDKAPDHMQEQAQMDLKSGSNGPKSESQQNLLEPRNASDTSDGFPLVDDNAGPMADQPKPTRTINSQKSRKVLFESPNADALSCISNKAADDGKGSSNLRKMSPSNIGKMFKVRKSQMLNRQDHFGGENLARDANDSSPNSTPGSSRLQFLNGNGNGRLRKKASEGGFSAQKGSSSTPRSASQSISTTPSGFEDSPSQKAKDCLVARLSRPFNMDVPPENRPFDSMFLGKRTPGLPDTMGSSRLSVAQQVPKGSRESPITGYNDGTAKATALPPVSSTVGRSASRVLGMLTSKRMVSNFLRSRRGERSTSQQSVTAGSPAFL